MIIDVTSPPPKLREINAKGNKPDRHDNQGEVSLGVHLVVPMITTYADVPEMDGMLDISCTTSHSKCKSLCKKSKIAN